MTTYQDIAVIMGLPTTGSHMAKEVGHILGEISEDECLTGRPMLSAVAVGVSGKPGPGFYTMAKSLNRFNGDDAGQQEHWENERDEVYKAWKRPLP
jgi:hypothetical protein